MQRRRASCTYTGSMSTIRRDASSLLPLLLLVAMVRPARPCEYRSVDPRHTMCAFRPGQCSGKSLLRKYTLGVHLVSTWYPLGVHLVLILFPFWCSFSIHLVSIWCPFSIDFVSILVYN
ncbi:uncharacterized protein LOC122261699 [Penaeus japonicus]|uniref:uncharacterized protein LOC122261699 n=1 Tax=Penaeus japonicus TaxID=27405 RepID=UPI001C712BE7|nr:uncharacterized protein LOC122261699 [Penaeus japonicus]